jgi:hypothetical protein
MNMNAGTTPAEAGTKDTRPNGAPPESTGEQAGKTRGRKPGASPQETSTHARFFLAKKDGTSAAPALDQELANEGEAMVEALKRGLSYFRVEEYRTCADLSGSAPMLKKEPVPRK